MSTYFTEDEAKSLRPSDTVDIRRWGNEWTVAVIRKGPLTSSKGLRFDVESKDGFLPDVPYGWLRKHKN